MHDFYMINMFVDISKFILHHIKLHNNKVLDIYESKFYTSFFKMFQEWRLKYSA